jgi:hypothetical protein
LRVHGGMAAAKSLAVFLGGSMGNRAPPDYVRSGSIQIPRDRAVQDRPERFISADCARAVGRVRYEVLIDQLAERAHPLNVLASSDDVIDLTGSAAAQHRIDAAAVIRRVRRSGKLRPSPNTDSGWPASGCAINNGGNFSAN